MAVTTENSTQYANTVATPPVKNAPYDAGTPKVFYFTHTQAVEGDATSLVNLVKLPAGKYRIILAQSCAATSDFGTEAQTLDIGHTGYTNFDGTAVPAAADAFCSAVDVATAAVTTYFTEGRADDAADMTFFVDSTTEVVIQGAVGTAAIPAGATIKGYVTIIGP